MDSSSIRPRPLPSKFVTIPHSPVVLQSTLQRHKYWQEKNCKPNVTNLCIGVSTALMVYDAELLTNITDVSEKLATSMFRAVKENYSWETLSPARVTSHKNVTLNVKDELLHAGYNIHCTDPHIFELRYTYQCIHAGRVLTLGCWHTQTQSALRATLGLCTADTAYSSALRKSRSASLSEKLPLHEGVFILTTITLDFLIIPQRLLFEIVTGISYLLKIHLLGRRHKDCDGMHT